MTPDPRLVHQASLNVMREILACVEEQAAEIGRLRKAIQQVMDQKHSACCYGCDCNWDSTAITLLKAALTEAEGRG